jgi:hypothetical protein
MVLTSGNEKVNLGLSLKFEAKALKVVGYSRKNGQYWEFSQKTVDLLKEYKVCRHYIYGLNTLTQQTIVSHCIQKCFEFWTMAAMVRF